MRPCSSVLGKEQGENWAVQRTCSWLQPIADFNAQGLSTARSVIVRETFSFKILATKSNLEYCALQTKFIVGPDVDLQWDLAQGQSNQGHFTSGGM